MLDSNIYRSAVISRASNQILTFKLLPPSSHPVKIKTWFWGYVFHWQSSDFWRLACTEYICIEFKIFLDCVDSAGQRFTVIRSETVICRRCRIRTRLISHGNAWLVIEKNFQFNWQFKSHSRPVTTTQQSAIIKFVRKYARMKNPNWCATL